MDTRATQDDESPDIGLGRIPKAFGYAVEGLAGAWRREAAFRQEALAAAVLIPLAALLPLPIVHRLALACSVLFVMVVELLNSSIESAIDRIRPSGTSSRSARRMAPAQRFSWRS